VRRQRRFREDASGEHPLLTPQPQNFGFGQVGNIRALFGSPCSSFGMVSNSSYPQGAAANAEPLRKCTGAQA
jgi:hypothetical protein